MSWKPRSCQHQQIFQNILAGTILNNRSENRQF